MELTIAIWEDCKRLLTDNQSITCRRLQPFADIKVHVEIKDGVVRFLYLIPRGQAYKKDAKQNLRRKDV